MGASMSCDYEYFKLVDELEKTHKYFSLYILITFPLFCCFLIYIGVLQQQMLCNKLANNNIKSPKTLKQDRQALNRQSLTLLNISEELEELLICPITLEVMYDPWIDIEGNTYEYAAIMEHLSRSHTSPITRNPMHPTDLYLRPNRLIRDIIQLYTKPAKLPSALTRN